MDKVITFEYGAMSSKWSIEADNKLTAYAAIVWHFDRNNHLVMLYEPKEIVKNDQWFNIFGKVSERLDEIFGGDGAFDRYFEEHKTEIESAYKTIKQIV